MHLELPTKRYYSIGEIAKAFDVNAKTYLKTQDQKSLDNFKIITKLERVKNELIKIKNQL